MIGETFMHVILFCFSHHQRKVVSEAVITIRLKITNKLFLFNELVKHNSG